MTILVVVVVLGIVIFVHELGHFLAAKAIGVQVLRFSIGFGPPILSWRRGETEYWLAWIPLGGYVKMAGENAEEGLTGSPDEFLSKSKWQRFQVMIMGPVMNILLAVVVMAVVLAQGAEVPVYQDQPPVVGAVAPGSPADLAGMRIRLMPSQMHARTFQLLGADAFPCDLKEGLEAIRAGTVDAQENPLSNTVTYGAHKFHRYVTLSGHCYMSRGLYLNRPAFEAWPAALQSAIQRAAREAIALQRRLAEAEEETARKALEAEGCKFVELTAAEREAFARAVRPLHEEARKRFGDEMFSRL